jgi:hypothetical protein
LRKISKNSLQQLEHKFESTSSACPAIAKYPGGVSGSIRTIFRFVECCCSCNMRTSGHVFFYPVETTHNETFY